ncbi:hypothetical protein ElyMa_006600500, partial [Elysia marginata]
VSFLASSWRYLVAEGLDFPGVLTIETLSTRTVAHYAYVKIGKADQGNYKNNETSF